MAYKNNAQWHIKTMHNGNAQWHLKTMHNGIGDINKLGLSLVSGSNFYAEAPSKIQV
jgi:hypothetical protein